ncbi:hypothetical protein J6Q66_09265 [bacterium]|nr:hypothetical protein [bacterium]
MTNFNIDKIGDNAHLFTNVILNDWNNLAISEILDEEIEAKMLENILKESISAGDIIGDDDSILNIKSNSLGKETVSKEQITTNEKSLIHLDSSNFNNEIKNSEGTKYVILTSSKCGQCQYIDKIKDNLATKLDDGVQLATMDYAVNQDVSHSMMDEVDPNWGTKGYKFPLVIRYEDGKAVDIVENVNNFAHSSNIKDDNDKTDALAKYLNDKAGTEKGEIVYDVVETYFKGNAKQLEYAINGFEYEGSTNMYDSSFKIIDVAKMNQPVKRTGTSSTVLHGETSTNEDFNNEVRNTEGTTFVIITSDSCSTCRKLESTLKNATEELDGKAQFVTVSGDHANVFGDLYKECGETRTPMHMPIICKMVNGRAVAMYNADELPTQSPQMTYYLDAKIEGELKLNRPELASEKKVRVTKETNQKTNQESTQKNTSEITDNTSLQNLLSLFKKMMSFMMSLISRS